MMVFPVDSCPICGKTGKYDEMQECIKSHNIPDEIVGFDEFADTLNSPAYLFIRCSSGKIIRYQAICFDDKFDNQEDKSNA